MYEYAFEGKDLDNLQRSLVRSLKKAKAFRNVVAADQAPTPGADTWTLSVVLESRNMEMSAAVSTCDIVGTCKLVPAGTGTPLEHRVKVTKDNVISIRGAKQAAIKSFVKECSGVFQLPAG